MTTENGRPSDGQVPHYYDNGHVSAELSLERDAEWLSNLSEREITDDWIKTANEVACIASRRTNGKDDSNQWIRETRRYFFGQLMGWADPNSQFNSVYNSFDNEKSSKRSLIPNTFIASERLLSTVEDLDLVKLLINNPSSSQLGPDLIQSKLDIYQSRNLSAGRIFSAAARTIGVANDEVNDRLDNLEDQQLIEIVEKDPKVLLRPSEVVNWRLGKIHRVAGILGWQGDVHELVTRFPQIIGLSDRKLFTHAVLFAKFGDPEWEVPDVSNIITNSVDVSILSLASGSNPDYNYIEVIKTGRRISPKDRPELVENLMKRSKTKKLLGERVVRAYHQYANSKLSA